MHGYGRRKTCKVCDLDTWTEERGWLSMKQYKYEAGSAELPHIELIRLTLAVIIRSLALLDA